MAGQHCSILVGGMRDSAENLLEASWLATYHRVFSMDVLKLTVVSSTVSK